jgi:Domain of unknown function (DUF4124)
MKRLMLFAALIVWSGMASAVVYKWVDAQGKLQYGDRPPDGVHAELVEMLGNHAASNNSARPAPAQNNSSSLTSTSKTATSDSAGKDDAQRVVDEDVATTRDKQCTDAQDRYKKLIEGRKIYKAGPDGERQYLSSEQVDTERVNAKRDIDNICNSPT